MAKRVQIDLVDDIDGSSASERVMFGLDGHLYEVDLSEWRATALREALEVFVASARPTTPVRSDVVTPAMLRSWAKENGFDVSARGQVPARIREAYDEASITR